MHQPSYAKEMDRDQKAAEEEEKKWETPKP